MIMSSVNPVDSKGHPIDSRVANETQGKTRVLHSQSSTHFEIMKKSPRRGSLDISVSPIKLRAAKPTRHSPESNADNSFTDPSI